MTEIDNFKCPQELRRVACKRPKNREYLRILSAAPRHVLMSEIIMSTMMMITNGILSMEIQIKMISGKKYTSIMILLQNHGEEK
jgi:hypothetical protein